MGPQDPKDVTRDTARDLSGLAGELAALKADARHWLASPEYAVLHLRLENAHAAVEAALKKVPGVTAAEADLKTQRIAVCTDDKATDEQLMQAVRGAGYEAVWIKRQKSEADALPNIEKGEEETMKQIVNIEGMMCEHCVAAVTKALQSVSGVTEMRVVLSENRAYCKGTPTDAELRTAIQNAGYQVKKIIR